MLGQRSFFVGKQDPTRKAFSMRTLFTLAVAVAAFATMSMTESTAQAQTLNNGFQFGTGVNLSGGFGSGFDRGINSGFGGFGRFGRFGSAFRNVERQRGLPYFAQFPPVYYSHIVRRPYGISPFAAPPGIAPVELSAPAQPITISNPFFDQEVAPVSSESFTPVPDIEANDDDVTWITNPYLQNYAVK